MWLWNNKSGHTHKRIKTDNEFGRLLTANLNLDKYIHLSCILNWPLSSVISTTKQHTTYFSGSRPLYCQRRLLTSGVRSEESALHCVLAQSDHPWCSALACSLNDWCRWQLITIKAALFDRLRHIHLFNVVRVDIYTTVSVAPRCSSALPVEWQPIEMYMQLGTSYCVVFPTPEWKDEQHDVWIQANMWVLWSALAGSRRLDRHDNLRVSSKHAFVLSMFFGKL